MTKTQTDQLGNRLRRGDITDADVRLLDSYRRSFTDAYEEVFRLMRENLGLEPTGRPAKSTSSIVDKLGRESIRLSQMQDIAGCRLVILDTPTQDAVVKSLESTFTKSTTIDRRLQPSHGYRAVHIVVAIRDRLVEIQVRTALEHMWAELSEKLSDLVDPAIKYGGGPVIARDALARFSELVGQLEVAERAIAELPSSHVGPRRDRLNELKKDTQDRLQVLIRELTEIGRGPDAFSN